MKTIYNKIIAAWVTYFMLIPGMASADWEDYGGWHMGSHMTGWTGMGYGGGWMIFIWVAVFVILVVLIRWMLSLTQKEFGCSAGHKTALDILKERFARGEIDEAEFTQKRRLLSENK